MRAGSRFPGILAVLAVIVLPALGGCGGPTLTDPATLHSPAPYERILAVAPFLNESGVSRLDEAHVADLFAQEAEQVRGIRTIPVNRVIAAMQALQIDAVTTEHQARSLMHLLNVDGLVVGTIVTYDAHPPLRLGMAVELVTRDRASAGTLDRRQSVRSPAGEPTTPTERGVARVRTSGLFEASNHETRRQLEQYAAGRSVPDSAYGGRIYEVSMAQYTRFVSHRLLGDLFAQEQRRMDLAAAERTTSR